jgi:hypothetical protein
MRHRLALLALCAAPLLAVACGSNEDVQQNQVGSTQAAVAATPTGVADCGHYPLPRRMSQYIANPIDSYCRLAVATLVESVPDCATGTPADRAKADHIAQIARQQIENGVPPDQVYALIRDDARDLAARKAC